MSVKVFIDGSAGTTGLRIADRLAARPEIELLSISEEGRKDVNERAKVINSADLEMCIRDRYDRVIDTLTGIFTPILPPLTAAGMIKAVLAILVAFKLDVYKRQPQSRG